MDKTLSCRQLRFSYDHRMIIDSLSLQFRRGSLNGIIGPNGCGKSTLLHLLAGLLKPTGGRVMLGDKNQSSLPRRTRAKTVSCLPQSPRCPDLMTAGRLLEHGRYPWQGLFSRITFQDRLAVSNVRDALGLGELLAQPMGQLSGGQRQKVWLGMTLVRDCPVILLDEPVSALDLGHQMEVLEYLSLHCRKGKTIVIVIHDLTLAAAYCHQIVALKNGSCLASGTPSRVITKSHVSALYGARVTMSSAGPDRIPVISPDRQTTASLSPHA